MKRIVLAALSLLALLALAGLAVFFLSPGTLVSLTQARAASAAGLTAKTVTHNGETTHYYEGGEGPTILLLHGMGDEKNSFVGVAGALTSDYTVILPDLREHGENDRDTGRDVSIAGQVGYVQSFADALGLDAFVIGGNSMGGHTSAAFATEQPDRVRALILVNAPGLVLDDHVVYGGFAERPETTEDLNAIFARVLYDPPELPGPIARHMIAQVNADFDTLNRMAETIRQGPLHDLSDRVETIEAPTLIF